MERKNDLCKFDTVRFFISLPEPKAHWWAYSTGIRPLSVVSYPSSSTFSNIFSAEPTGPVDAKFHMEPPWIMEKKVCSNGYNQDGRHAHIG